jgi:hypothetical protein
MRVHGVEFPYARLAPLRETRQGLWTARRSAAHRQQISAIKKKK